MGVTMARKADAIKHPALAARKIVPVEEESNSWRDLTDEQRMYMTVYLDCMDAAMACELTDRSMEWGDEQRVVSDAFGGIFHEAMHEPRRLSEQIAGVMLPASMVKLRALIMQNDNKASQLAAIKHLHSIAGMMPEGSVAAGGNFVNVNVTGLPGVKD